MYLMIIPMNWNKGMATMTLTAGISQLRPSNCNGRLKCQQPQAWQLGFLYMSLTLLVIGSGCIRPCNIAFGADQFDTTTKKGRSQLEIFFNWWYFSFTISLIVALTGVIYVQTDVSWFLGFLIPTLCLCLSVTIFLLGRDTYIRKKPQGSVFTDVAMVVTASCRKRTQKIQPNSVFYDDAPERRQHLPELRLRRTSRFQCLDKAALVINLNELNEEREAKNGWKLCSIQQVERLKCILGSVPVWITGIACFMSMDQQATFGILQSIQMNRSIGSHFEVPPSWVSLVPMIALAIWIIIYETFYVPLTNKIMKQPKRLTMHQRINIGIVMSILCMVVAGILERKRRHSSLQHHTFTSPITFAWLLPQFMLSGLTEAFAAVAVMEFLSTQMPESMRTVAGAIFFLTMSISSYLGSFLVNIIHIVTRKNGKHPWLGGHDLNQNRLEYYYYIIAAIGVLNMVYFNLFASKYLERNVRWCDEEEQKNNLNSQQQYQRNRNVEEEEEEEICRNLYP